MKSRYFGVDFKPSLEQQLKEMYLEERMVKRDNTRVDMPKNLLKKTRGVEWLKRLHAPKFYRYFFYRQYVLSKKWGNIQPAFSSLMVIALTGVFNFFPFLWICGNIEY